MPARATSPMCCTGLWRARASPWSARRCWRRCASSAGSSSWAAPSARRSNAPAPPSGTATAIPTTCSARRRAPPPMPGATTPPTARRSRRSAPPSPAAMSKRRRASRSSSRRCTRATRWPSASASWASCCRASPISPRRRARPGSASPSTPRRPTASTCLDLVEALAGMPELAGWDGLGLAVQAYQKRAPAVIDWLADLAARTQRRLMVRLVKGAYWDSEIKRAQERGYAGYPVYTRKVATDVSYLACARRLFAGGAAFYPQFATHNAHTLAAVLEFAGTRTDWEFQRLHGMGEALYEAVTAADGLNRPCRVYAPVGGHEDLLAYLVRRLLENGANA